MNHYFGVKPRSVLGTVFVLSLGLRAVAIVISAAVKVISDILYGGIVLQTHAVSILSPPQQEPEYQFKLWQQSAF
ncbi:MAG: hypothetical protein ACPGSB_06495 [Opitutales bacterium]